MESSKQDSAFERYLGQMVPLIVVAMSDHGARLRPLQGRADQPTLLLPNNEVARELMLGDTLEVFVYRDSDDRVIATLRPPKLLLDQVAFLEVTDLTDFGAFFNWNMAKELLVPHAEQTAELYLGDRHPVGLYVDNSGRLAGTMRVSEMLREPGHYEVGAWVSGEAWRRDQDIGIFVILERRHVALLPRSEPTELGRGEAGSFRVTRVHPDGRLEVSMRDLAHRQTDHDAQKILDVLRSNHQPFGDRSSPEQIEALFGLSKKAFKRALGGLLKRGEVLLDADGFVRLAVPPTR